MIFVLLCIFVGICVFLLKKSTLKKEFERDVLFLMGQRQTTYPKKEYPSLVQEYLERTGLDRQASIVHIKYEDVSYAQSQKGPFLKMRYEQYNSASTLVRYAYMKSSMFGITFEGYDVCQKDHSSMRGVLAKFVPLFHQKGKALEEGNLVTVLAESMLLPSTLNAPDIQLEQINANQVKGILKRDDIEVSGIFTFNEQKEYVSFYTEKRPQMDQKGNINYFPWEAVCTEYKNIHGIYRPTKFKAVWKEVEDFVYFDGKITEIEYKHV